MFNSCGGTLRSKYYPDKIQSGLMSIFRVPLNLLVVIGTNLAGYAGADIEKLQSVFAVVVGMHLIALLLQVVIFIFYPPPAPEDLNAIVDGGVVEKKKKTLGADFDDKKSNIDDNDTELK